MECLGLNIYHESRNEATAGQIAVGQTTINRVRSTRFPNTVWDVGYQGYHVRGKPVRDGCEFSWYCDGFGDNPTNLQAYRRSIEIANWLLMTERWIPDITDGSLWYHADYVSPNWGRVKKRTMKIDTHIFYR